MLPTGDRMTPAGQRSTVAQLKASEFKFEKLEVWQLSLDHIGKCYALPDELPKREEFNLQSQLIRAPTSIALNIAEGSTSQTDPEHARFLALALRSLVETVACRRLAQHRHYTDHLGSDVLSDVEQLALKLFAKLQGLRRVLGERHTAVSTRSNITGSRSTADRIDIGPRSTVIGQSLNLSVLCQQSSVSL